MSESRPHSIEHVVGKFLRVAISAVHNTSKGKQPSASRFDLTMHDSRKYDFSALK
jgi:hypothetical protein